MRRFCLRAALLAWLAAGVLSQACTSAIVSLPDVREITPPTRPDLPTRGRSASIRSDAEVHAAVAAILDAGRHPRLRWPDIARYVAALKSASGEPDGLFWFDDGVAHASLEGALRCLSSARTYGLPAADFDAEVLGARWRDLQRTSQASAGDLAEFDTALSVSVMRFLASVHEGRVDPRIMGFDYDVAAKRLDPLDSLRSARDGPGGMAGAVDRVSPKLATYRRLLDALSVYRQLAADGEPPGVPALRAGVKKIEPGQPWEGAAALAARLRTFGDLANDLPRPPAGDGVPLYDSLLADAVRRFQHRHALEPDGVIGPATIAALNVPLASRVRQIELAVERERWLPDLVGRPFLVVNVPLFHLWASEPDREDEPLMMNVVVGKALGHETPIFIDEMEYIVFRPYWNPPPSIVRKEIIPRIRKDPHYLASEDMEIVPSGGGGGGPLPPTPENVQRVLDGTLLLRQRPGPKNALGPAKFIFPNDENVYMHGTPDRDLFLRARRDFSHGCIRVEDPLALAEWLLRDQPDWTRERILAAMDGAAPTQVNLRQKMTVMLIYDTVYIDSKGTVHFAGDYYAHDAKLVDALSRGFPYPRTR